MCLFANMDEVAVLSSIWSINIEPRATQFADFLHYLSIYAFLLTATSQKLPVTVEKPKTVINMYCDLTS